jgi:transposase-like protein
MTVASAEKAADVKCPSCNSTACYKYGKAWTGKKRFLCLICGRQFTFGSKKIETKVKPRCPACGRLMHVYKRETGSVRLRCSAYPICRTFKKLPQEE